MSWEEVEDPHLGSRMRGDTSSLLLMSSSYGRDTIYCFLEEGTSQLLLGDLVLL